MNLLAVSNDYYRKSPKSVEGIVAAYIEGIATLKTRKPQALKMLEKYMGQRGGGRSCTMSSSRSILTRSLASIRRRSIRCSRWSASRGRKNEALRQQHRRPFGAAGFDREALQRRQVVTEEEWRECLGEMVRDYIRSPELEHYFSIKMTKPRAAIMVTQQSLFVRHRRDCWAHVSANCPVLAVKQRILAHEYEEIIRDDFSDYGHLHLIIRQGKSVGLEPEEILNSEPLPRPCGALRLVLDDERDELDRSAGGYDHYRVVQRRSPAGRLRRRTVDAHGEKMDGRDGFYLEADSQYGSPQPGGRET